MPTLEERMNRARGSLPLEERMARARQSIAPESPIPGFVAGVASGIPIVGPAVLGAVERTGAFLTGQPLSQVQAETERLRETDAFTAGEVTGGIASTLPLGVGVLGARLFGTAARAALTGGAIGATDVGVRTDFDPEKVAVGGVMAAGGGAVGQFFGRLVGRVGQRFAHLVRPGQKPPTTVEQIRTQANAAYDQMDAAGVVIKPERLTRGVNELKAAMKEADFDATLNPKAARALEVIEERAQSGQLTLRELDNTRRFIRNQVGSSTDPAEQRMAGMMIDSLDEMINGLKQADISAGDVTAGVAALNEARTLWHQMRRAEVVGEMFEKAERSTVGFDRAIRNEFRSLLNNTKRRRAFSKEERAAMEAVVKGGPVERAVNTMIRLDPLGVMSLIFAGGGYMSFGLPGLAAGMARPAASAARRGLEARTGQQARRVGAGITGEVVPAPPTAGQLGGAGGAGGVLEDTPRRRRRRTVESIEGTPAETGQ